MGQGTVVGQNTMYDEYFHGMGEANQGGRKGKGSHKAGAGMRRSLGAYHTVRIPHSTGRPRLISRSECACRVAPGVGVRTVSLALSPDAVYGARTLPPAGGNSNHQKNEPVREFRWFRGLPPYFDGDW